MKEFTGSSNYTDETNWPWWWLVNELKSLDGMLDRFHKENGKLMLEKRQREREVKELQDLLYKESKKVEDYKCKVLRDTGSALVAEEELNLREANSLGIKNAIDVKEIEEMRAENTRLKAKLDEKECDFKVKEIKLKNEIEQL